MKLDLQVGVIALAAITSTGAHAELIDLENGAIYESVRDVTWTKDVRYQETVLEPNPGPALLQGSVVMNADGTSHVVTALDIYQAGGGASAGTGRYFWLGGTWWGATAWAKSLSFAGASSWRLPTASELVGVLTQSDFNQTFERFSHPFCACSLLFWTSDQVGLVYEYDSVHQVQTVPFSDPSYYVNVVAKSADRSDFRQIAWAVHDGNISPVPEPSTLGLFLLGGAFTGLCVSLRSSRAKRDQPELNALHSPGRQGPSPT